MADPSTAPPLIPSSIIEAHAKIKPYIHRTPLLTSKTLNAIASHPNPSAFLSASPPPLTSPSSISTNNHAKPTPAFDLYFKCENFQKIGAFKARGAHHALIRLIDTHGLPHIQSRGVITHSSGNHAQALALAAYTFKVPCHIVMPTISTPSKIAGTKMYTENVYFSGSTADEREAKVAEIMERTGAILVPPYDHPDIILGQGTAAFEMEEQFQELKQLERQREKFEMTNGHSIGTDTTINSSTDKTHQLLSASSPRFDAVLAPLGGGGLLGGTATWFSHTHTQPSPTQDQESQLSHPGKKTLIFGVEPSFSGANDAERGLAASPPTRIPHVSSLTIADGLRTPVGLLNWRVISDKTLVTGVYSASEAQITNALRLVMERVKVFVEPSAVVGVAVVLFCMEFRELVARAQREESERDGSEGAARPWDVGIVFSGGNTTVEAVGTLFGGGGDAERETGQVGVNGERRAEDVAG